MMKFYLQRKGKKIGQQFRKDTLPLITPTQPI